MGLQVRTDNSKKPFILESGLTVLRSDAVLLQDAGRATDLLFGTLMAKIAASGKLVPFTDETAVDGSAVPYGVYFGEDIAAADIVAGDVSDLIVIKGGAVVIDENQLVIENSKALTTAIGTGVTLTTVGDELNKKGIFVKDSVEISSFEN